MSNTTDRRRHPRHAQDERVIVQIISSSDDTLPAGMIVKCASKDISTQGLKIQAQRRASQGTKLELWVEIFRHPSKFYLSGVVKWCQSLEDDGRYLVGIELTDGQAQDLELWQRFLEESDLAAAGQT